MVFPRTRHIARREMGLYGTGVGRVLGLGSGRKCFAHTVAYRDRIPPLGDDSRKEGHAEGMESVSNHTDLRVVHLRHLPYS